VRKLMRAVLASSSVASSPKKSFTMSGFEKQPGLVSAAIV
jgi:hypothetical protein